MILPYIYISASWKQRLAVRLIAKILEDRGFQVYDFTNPACRTTPELPPEGALEQFDPAIHNYRQYLLEHRPGVVEAMRGNRKAIDECDAVVLLLPCGTDATADWAYAVGMGKSTYILGAPEKGHRSPTHLWADEMFESIDDLITHLTREHL